MQSHPPLLPLQSWVHESTLVQVSWQPPEPHVSSQEAEALQVTSHEPLWHETVHLEPLPHSTTTSPEPPLTSQVAPSEQTTWQPPDGHS